MRALRASSTLFVLVTLALFSRRAGAAPEAPAPVPVHLVFVAYEGAVLEERVPGGDDEWASICDRGCELDLDFVRDVERARYRIKDAKGQESFSFRISAEPGERVVVTARPGSPVGHEVGVWMSTIGGLGLAASAVALVVVGIESVAQCRSDPNYATGGTYGGDCPSFAPVVLALAASAAVLTVGIALVVADDPSTSQAFERSAQSLVRRKPSTAERVPSDFVPPRVLSSARDEGLKLPPPHTATLVTLHF